MSSARAQSEVIGMILLTGVIVISVGTAGAVVLSGSGVASEERVTADVSIEIADDGIGLTHEGGDSIAFGEIRVVVRHGNDTWRPPVNASGVRNGDGDERFDPSERWIGNRSLDTDVVTTVQVFHVESGALLGEARRYPSGQSLTVAPSPAESDTTDPTVTVTSPESGDKVRGGTSLTVEWNATDMNTSVESIDIQYTDGDGDWQTLVTNAADDGSQSVQVPTDSTDNARIRVRAVDTAGNTAFAESPTFTVDGDQPSIDSITPNASAQTEVDAGVDGWEDVSVSWTASDPTTSVGDVTISIQNATETVATANASGASGTVDVALPNDTAEDVYDVEVEVVDSVGNGQQRTAPDAVVVGDGGNDTTPPTISQFNLTNPSGKQLNVTFESSEPLSEINVTISKANSRVVTLTESNFTRDGDGPYTYSATSTVGENGKHTATLNVAADETGNDGANNQSSDVQVVPATMAGRTTYAGNLNTGGNSSIVFDILNTGQDDVQVTNVSVSSEISDAEQVYDDADYEFEVAGGSQKGYASDKNSKTQAYDTGSTYDFEQNAIIGTSGNTAKATVELGLFGQATGGPRGGGKPSFTKYEFSRLERVSSQPQADIVVVIGYSDGSTDTFYFKES